MKSAYIVISQTGSLLSRAISCFTGSPYSHSSLSLDCTFETMFSFGRLHPYDPFVGGFVREGRSTGTFKRFADTRVLVLHIPVSDRS